MQRMIFKNQLQFAPYQSNQRDNKDNDLAFCNTDYKHFLNTYSNKFARIHFDNKFDILHILKAYYS